MDLTQLHANLNQLLCLQCLVSGSVGATLSLLKSTYASGYKKRVNTVPISLDLVTNTYGFHGSGLSLQMIATLMTFTTTFNKWCWAHAHQAQDYTNTCTCK